MNKSALNTFYAEIDWLCIPMEAKIEIINGKKIISGKLNSGGFPREEMGWVDRTMNPAKWKADFWKDIRQWYFAFHDNDVDRVKGYYRLYGPLSPYHPMNLEKSDFVKDVNSWADQDSWELNELTLGWFNLLTCMFDWLKQQNAGPLWDLFPKRMPNSPGVFIYPENTAIGECFTSQIDFAYGIRCFALHTDDDDPGFYKLTNENELFELTWYCIVSEVDKVMNRLRLEPNMSSYKDLSLTWVFYASGAFEAAFLQWYFQELSHYRVSHCANVHCEKLVLPSLKRRGKEKKYCCERCRWAANKRRQRKKTNP